MQLRHLKTFAAVASTLNITRAAERVHLAQSSVTEQIQALEADLGTALFDRSRRGLCLTAAGRRLLDYAAPLLALADEARAAVADAAGTTAGPLAVGGLETLCAGRLPPLLAAFRRDHPAVALTVAAAGSGALRDGVRAGGLDVAFVFAPDAGDPDLLAETVADEELVVIAPPGHRLAGRAAVAPEDLADEPFLVTERGCVYRRMFEAAFPAAGVRPPLAGEFGSIAAIRGLVEAGAGCALVPRLALAAGPDRDGPAPDRLAVLPWAGGERTVPLAMLWRRRRVQRPALARFLDAARRHFGVTPAGARPRRAAPCR
ncbi:LysR family transcriptional regulator [Azospirillum sp. A39]|uniref:LysR family transcriptional regulator n=1 Tax=Azospirillum sp. A39 TaxID=3462279 RepID=UPI0040460572